MAHETPEIQTGTDARITSLLTNGQLHRLERLRLNATRRFTDKMHGEHLRGRGGTSTEFSDFRDYAPGDDVRFVDWNIFARLNRPYLKLYQIEELMHVVLLIDASASMGFEGKLDRAKSIAAAFGAMGLLGNERVSAYVLHGREGAPTHLPICVGRGSMSKLFSFIEPIEPGGTVPVDEGIDLMLRYHVGRGVVIVLSDFLTFGDMSSAFNRFFSRGLEIFALQILGPTEIDPEVAGDLRLVDSETQTTLDISGAGDLLALYQEYLEGYQGTLAEQCRQRGGRYEAVSSGDSLDWTLFDLLRRRGWVR